MKNGFVKDLMIGLTVGLSTVLFLLACDFTESIKTEDQEIEYRVEPKREQKLKGTVVKVKDGDTIVILTKEMEEFTIRLKSVDCPERKQAYGKKAKDFVINQIAGREVEIFDRSLDRYGRTIGYVYYRGFFEDKLNLSEELLKVGLAWHYTKYSNDSWLQELEDIARNLKNGLWRDSNPIAPWNFRKMNKN